MSYHHRDFEDDSGPRKLLGLIRQMLEGMKDDLGKLPQDEMAWVRGFVREWEERLADPLAVMALKLDERRLEGMHRQVLYYRLEVCAAVDRALGCGTGR